MKKVFISVLMAAVMAAAASCSCSNNSNSSKCSAEQCANCDKKDSCGEAEGCAFDATKCSDDKCASCDKKDECRHDCKGCDSTAVKDSCCSKR